MKYLSTLFILVLSFYSSAQNDYQKNYFDNGTLASEGWLNGNQKADYWKFYYENGPLESEGHYVNDSKNKWWLFYDSEEKINHKCQLKNNIKNGYCLMYKNEKLISAVKFSERKKIREWIEFASFKKENKLSDLK
jgi:antitoxin component YwqK of YwqJK toxin-antitoxin module